MQMLSAPLTDDPMETDADRRGETGEDIDIDLDFAGDDLLDEEDESMSEGEGELNDEILATTPQATNLFNDDEMVDGVHNENNEEEVLYDSTSLQDEDLQDVEDLIAAQPDQGDGIVDNAPAELTTAPLGTDTVRQEWLTASEDPNNQAPLQQNLPVGPNLQYHLPEPNLDLYTQGQQPFDGIQPPLSNGTAQAFPQVPNNFPETTNQGNEQPGGANNNVPEAVPGSLEQNQLPSTSVNGNSTNDPKSVQKRENLTTSPTQDRRITLSYEGSELSLFRSPDGEQDYLLEDEKLIDESIVKLLAACKPILGDDVRNHELVIGVDDLDLDISEFAVEASITTVSHLNEIFLKLQVNDRIESPKALHLNLYSRPSISDRLSYLRSAVDNGIGLSVVSRVAYNPADDLYSENNDELTGENGETERVVAHELDEQSFEESSETVDQEETLSVHSDSAILDSSNLQRLRSLPKVEKASKSAKDTTKVEQSPDKGIDSGDLKNHNTNGSSNEQRQQEKTPKLAVGDDEDDIINYEDHEVIGSKPSSGNTTTVRGDGDSAKIQSLPSAAQPALTTQSALPGTETSSNTIEGNLTNELSNPLHENTRGHDGADEPKEQDNRQGVEGDYEGGHEYYQDVGENEYGTSLEGHEQDHINQNQNVNYEPTEFQPQPFDGGLEANDTIASKNLELQDLNNNPGVYVDPNKGNDSTEQDFEAAGKGIIEDSVFLEGNQDQIDDFEQSLDVGCQDLVQSEAFLDDGDEITFDDDDEGHFKPSNIGQDQLLNPKDLKKRSRSGTDADDDTASDPQDAKRIRSN